MCRALFFSCCGDNTYLVTTDAPKPAALTALTSASLLTSLLAVTTALSGMLTSALETPSTPSSADRTLFTQPTPHVMPVTLSSTVFVSASAALISLVAVVLLEMWPAVTTPMGRAVIAPITSAFWIRFIFLLFVGLVFIGCV